MILNNQNNQNLISQIKKFANDIQSTGKSPDVLLDELIKSGRYTPSQIDNAKKMAQNLLGLFHK